VAGKLNTKKLASLKAGTKTADGGGLYAIVGSEGGVTWGFLFTINRRRRLMSLGKWPDVSLAAARDLATDARRKVGAGIDPIEDRKAATKRVPTFAEVADELIRSKMPAWKSPRSKDQWRQRLNDYAKPLRALPIDKIDTAAVLLTAVAVSGTTTVETLATAPRQRPQGVRRYVPVCGRRRNLTVAPRAVLRERPRSQPPRRRGTDFRYRFSGVKISNGSSR
jgi:hypothetical protein